MFVSLFSFYLFFGFTFVKQSYVTLKNPISWKGQAVDKASANHGDVKADIKVVIQRCKWASFEW